MAWLPSPFFSVIAGHVEGYDMSVFGQVEGEIALERKLFLPCLCVGGRKGMHGVVQNDIISFKKKWHQKCFNFQIDP
jgi:hypothetical protein